MYSLYSVISLLLWVGEGLDEETFQTACDIHSPRGNISADVLHSQSTILPQKASSDWLFESQPAIKQWYEKGKRECNAYLATSSASFGSKFPDPYRTDGPPGGQNKCRGTDMLYSLTGTIVWPFGPKNCSTYRKCWFGLLTCGEAKSKALQELGKDYILKVLHINQPEKSLPVMDHWSIRALKIHLRVIGLEIIVPQQRFFSISPQDDVIIAQYTVTLPYDSYKLEMRQEELYPSALYQWDTQQIDLYGMEIPGNIYLGGSESRNRPQTTVKMTNNCCGCDEKSFVVGTPITMKVSNGIEACPNVLEMRRMFDGDPGHNIINSNFIDNNDSKRSNKGKLLPLCKARSSSEPGRWILSSPTRQQSNLHTIACNTLSTAFNDVPKIQKPLIKHGRTLSNINSINEPNKNNSSTYNKWFEASGDPCIVRNVDNEDMKEGSWFFAPYKCKYHFYTKPELNRCLALKNISHIHFHGDSMSRDIFLYVARYLGVSTLTEDGLKHMTNSMNQKKIKVYSGKVLMSEGNRSLILLLIMNVYIFSTLKRIHVDAFS
jgi:hypothetical protein